MREAHPLEGRDGGLAPLVAGRARVEHPVGDVLERTQASSQVEGLEDEAEAVGAESRELGVGGALDGAPGDATRARRWAARGCP